MLPADSVNVGGDCHKPLLNSKKLRGGGLATREAGARQTGLTIGVLRNTTQVSTG